MTKPAKHSPLPWNVARSITGTKPFVHEKATVNGNYTYDCVVECGQFHLALVAGESRVEAIANAQYIVQACNAFPALVEALEGLLADKYLADPINADRMANARAALALARGGGVEGGGEKGESK